MMPVSYTHLFLAKTTGEKRLMNMADSHAQTTLRHPFRDDYSCYHVVSYDTLSGQPRCVSETGLVLIHLVISQNHSRNCLGYCLHNINTVSYTHLDVYKRQVPAFMDMNSRIWTSI